jgi:hypothetical protein
MRKAPAATARRGSGLWLQGLVCGALATLATPTALLGGVLLAPSIVIYLADDTPGRPALRAVLLFGLAATVHPMMALWTGGHTLDVSVGLLSDLAVPALAWSAQGAGWLLAQLIPLGVRLVLEGQTKLEVARLRGERTKLAEEWGLPEEEEKKAS